jgi:hypothetical protein
VDITPTLSGVYGFEDRSWVAADPGPWTRRPCTLDISAFSQATHYPDGYIKSGTAIAKLPSGLYGPASDTVDGFLWDTMLVPTNGTTRIGAPLWEFGFVVTAKLPVQLSEAAITSASSWFKFETV